MFDRTATKLVWLALQPFFYAFRPMLVYKRNVTNVEIVNWVVILISDYAIAQLFGIYRAAAAELLLRKRSDGKPLVANFVYRLSHFFTLSPGAQVGRWCSTYWARRSSPWGCTPWQRISFPSTTCSTRGSRRIRIMGPSTTSCGTSGTTTSTTTFPTSLSRGCLL